jgi:polyisoprenyl-phosphate glycosyltransferase
MPEDEIHSKTPTSRPHLFTNVERSELKPAIHQIPTSDPQEALQFCKNLAAFLADQRAKDKPYSTLNISSREYAEQITDKTQPPIISVVIPVYDEQDNLPLLYQRLTAVLEETEPDYQVVFVDDGSRDGSLNILRELVEKDERVILIELARNFGHQVAISAGLDYALGQGVVIMDADLQDPPEVLPQFIAKWREGHDVVYAIRTTRKENWLMRIAYAAFYRLLSKIANIHIPLDAGDFCIMDRKVVDLLVGMPERNRFVRGIRSWVGLDQVGLAYQREARNAGKPKFTLTRLVYLALDGLISFSYLPLRAITVMGFGVSLISICLAVFYAVKRLTVGLSPPGFATTIVAILFLAGMQLITIGVIGEYIGRIFEEVKRRPLYVVRKVTGKK